MENLPRNLAKDARVKNPGRPYNAPRRWTVLLIGEVGKVVSFHVTKSLLLALPALLAAILAVATYSVVSYNSLRIENSQLRNNVDMLRAKLEAAEKARENASVRLMVLEDSARQTAGKAAPPSRGRTKDATSKVTKPRPAAKHAAIAKPSETPKPVAEKIAKPNAAETATAEAAGLEASEIPKPAPGEAVRGEPSETAKPVATQTARLAAGQTAKPAAAAILPAEAEEDKILSPPSPTRILVKDLEVWRKPDGSAFKFQFALKNIDREGGRIAGYTFLVFKPQEGSGEPIRSFPWSPLKDGKPAIFKRGQYFAISHFKSVRGTLTDVSTIDRFETATVYVYSDTGDLLTEEVFEVGKISRS
jgi:hypothetical protein